MGRLGPLNEARPVHILGPSDADSPRASGPTGFRTQAQTKIITQPAIQTASTPWRQREWPKWRLNSNDWGVLVTAL